MADFAPLQPVTDAEIEIVPWIRRAQALAGSGIRLRPALRTVREQIADPEGYADTDVMLAMYARIGCEQGRSLVGTIMARELARYPTRPAGRGLTMAPQIERLILLEHLWMSDAMAQWRPPLRTLLISTAAMITATVAHDDTARTCVACRIDNEDEMGARAIGMLGARARDPSPAQLKLDLWPDVDRFDNLHFLNSWSAARAAEVLLSHLDRDVKPAKAMRIGGPDGRIVEGLMTLRFPRSVSALREEIAEIARQQVRLDWRRPAIAINDLDREIRRVTIGNGR